jgi:hypothetical protein
VAASGTAPLSYAWQRNGAPITGATSPTYTLASAALADNGAQFRCVVSNAFGVATSNAATLTVTSSNGAPVPTILTPAAGTLYSAGTTIAYSGSATDPEDGTLTGSRFTWEVVFHHDTHTHPFVQPTTGSTSGSFVIPDTGETSANVWYRINLTVVDSTGQSVTVFRDVRPRTVQVTLASSPAGFGLTLDGQPIVGPVTFTGVVGMKRSIGAPASQTQNGTVYDFKSWSDHGAATHIITTPTSNATFTATYRTHRGK